jgi:DNA-binding NarL/FixJ family response regulator
MSQSETPHLTNREKQILLLISQGMTNKEIAQLLDITSRTVEFHIHNILGKLGLSSRTSAVLFAEKTGLLK